ncbi:DUF4012 domain-containing protein [Microbacterium sp. CPCC 204701]|uniref:DUF4012 domain-containing protein n=1 Tax=Microbacterium sp. CPCC 204701 TaxID=2493084 RepID=UPI000FD8DC2B|nr:DUF4012 domain-containing protein [Microbacterium sp. CPCC 204701]
MSVARTRLRSRRTAVLVAGAVLAALVIAGVWVCVRGLMAKAELEDAQSLVGSLQQATAERALPGEADLNVLALHTGRAAELTGDPIWRAAEILPFVGPNLEAVRVVSAEMDHIVSDAVAPLLSAAQDLTGGFRAADGAIDVEALERLQGPASQARDVLDAAARRLEGVDADAVVEPVGEGLARLGEVVALLRPAVTTLDDATALVPPVLGADSPRTILVALQNNAELRTGGGITGSFVELTAEAGRLTMTAQADSSHFASRDDDILAVPESVTALYGDRVGRFVQNAAMAADFELTAGLVSEWWRTLTGRTPDVVVSVDPLVLQAILRVTGPIQAAGQEFTPDELVPRLLIDPYMYLRAEVQSELFHEVAAAAFSRLTSADVDLVALMTALAEPVEQGRVSMWSAHEAEQNVLERTILAGPAARQARAGDDAFAVYLNDATGGKMDTFLEVAIGWGVADCRADDHRDIVVSVTLANRAPADAASVFPPSMTGGGWYGVRPGDIATNVAVSAPAGSFLAGVSVGNSASGSAEAQDAGFPVAAARVDLAPGESTTVDFRFVSADPGDLTPVILHTPMLQSPDIAQMPAACL